MFELCQTEFPHCVCLDVFGSRDENIFGHFAEFLHHFQVFDVNVVLFARKQKTNHLGKGKGIFFFSFSILRRCHQWVGCIVDSGLLVSTKWTVQQIIAPIPRKYAKWIVKLWSLWFYFFWIPSRNKTHRRTSKVSRCQVPSLLLAHIFLWLIHSVSDVRMQRYPPDTVKNQTLQSDKFNHPLTS